MSDIMTQHCDRRRTHVASASFGCIRRTCQTCFVAVVAVSGRISATSQLPVSVLSNIYLCFNRAGKDIALNAFPCTVKVNNNDDNDQGSKSCCGMVSEQTSCGLRVRVYIALTVKRSLPSWRSRGIRATWIGARGQRQKTLFCGWSVFKSAIIRQPFAPRWRSHLLHVGCCPALPVLSLHY